MSARLFGARARAALAGLVLFGTGVMVGVVMRGRGPAQAPLQAAAAPLTVESLSKDLDLDGTEQERVRVLLDSLQGAVAEAVASGADSLRAVSVRARRQIEEALPEDRRGRFRGWMQERHGRMMEAMGRGGMGRMMQGGRMRGPSR